MDRFRADPALAAVQWPDDVLRDLLFEHGAHGPFVDDYGHLDLSAVTCTLEAIPAADSFTMPAGESDAGLIDHFAQNPVYWASAKGTHVHHADEAGMAGVEGDGARRVSDPSGS